MLVSVNILKNADKIFLVLYVAADTFIKFQIIITTTKPCERIIFNNSPTRLLYIDIKLYYFFDITLKHLYYSKV